MALGGLLIVIVVLIVAFLIDWRLGLGVLLLGILGVGTMVFFRYQTGKRQQMMRKAQAQFASQKAANAELAVPAGETEAAQSGEEGGEKSEMDNDPDAVPGTADEETGIIN